MSKTISALDFLHRIASKQVAVDVCKFSEKAIEELKDSDILLRASEKCIKDSCSPTIIYFAELIAGAIQGNPVLPIALKVFTEDKNDNYSLKYFQTLGLRYEARLYEYITREIIDKGYSPNFIPFIAFGCCDTDSKCILMTERAGNGAQFGFNGLFKVNPLFEVFNNLSLKEQNIILFQLVYAINLLVQFKIVHNDLHTGNIFVVRYNELIKMKFIVNGVSFVFQTNTVPFIYDWDFGYAEELGRNEYLRKLKKINVTNDLDPYRDLYRLFCNLTDDDLYNPIVNSYTETPSMKRKEELDTFYITEEEYKKFLSQPFERVNSEQTLYKLTYAQFLDAIPDITERNFPTDIETIFCRVEKVDYHNVYMLTLWNPAACRMSVVSKNFPTPLELLMTEFKELESDEDAPFVYRTPNSGIVSVKQRVKPKSPIPPLSVPAPIVQSKKKSVPTSAILDRIDSDGII